MLILPNEWVLDYLLPTSGKAELAEQFISESRKAGHTYLIRRKSPFRAKLFRYVRQWPLDKKLKEFVALVLRASDFVVLLEENEIDAVEEEILSSIDDDDRYLVEVLKANSQAILVTTDAELAENTTALGLRAFLFQDNVEETLKKIAEIAQQAG